MYTNQPRVEAFLKRELTNDEASIIDDVIDSVSTFIDTYTNRSWTPVDMPDIEIEPTERIFDGNGQKELHIDDFQSLDDIVILDSYGAEAQSYSEADYILYPLNKLPKQSIRLRLGRFVSRPASVRITAVWGSGSVPRGITSIATSLVGKFLIKNTTITGAFKSESIEGYSYQLMTGADVDSDTDRLIVGLDQYKKYVL
jgi:hypothetical protein